MALRDVLVEFIVAVKGAKALDDVDASIKKTTVSANRLGGALSANRLGGALRQMTAFYVGLRVLRGIKNFIESTIDGAAALRAQAATLGLTTDELQKYQYVADALHTPTRQVAFAFRFFNRAVGEAALGTKHANKVFDDLGMKIKDSHDKIRPTADLLFEFADKLKKVPHQATRTALAMSTLGRGGAELLPLLQNGSVALKDMFQDVEDLGGGFNDTFVKQAAEARVYLVRLRFAIRGMGVAITQALLPGLEKWAYRLTKIAKDLAILGQKTWAFRTALIVLLPILTGLIGRLVLMTRLGAAAWAWVKTSLPELLVLSAILTTLYYVFDDLWTFAHGGDSVFGELLDDTGAGNALKFFKQMGELFGKIEEALKPLMDLIKSLGPNILAAFVGAMPGLIKWAAWFTNEFVESIDHAIQSLYAGFIRLKYWNNREEGEKIIAAMAQQGADRDKLYDHAAQAIDAIGKPPVKPNYEAAYGPSGGSSSITRQGPGGLAPGFQDVRDSSGVTHVTPVKPNYGAAFGPSGGSNTGAGGLAPGFQEVRDASGVTHVMPINIHVEVKGGPTNGDTANAVTKAVTGAGKSAATTIRDAHAAVNRGQMASQVGSQ